MLEQSKAFSGFSVDNLDKAKHFYQEILGLKVETNAMDMLELHVHGSTPILIYPKPDHRPATFTLLNFPVDSIEQAVGELTERCVQFLQYEAHNTDKKGIGHNGGPLIAWFKDPAGNILSIIETTQTS